MRIFMKRVRQERAERLPARASDVSVAFVSGIRCADPGHGSRIPVRSERDIAVLLRRVLVAFAIENGERGNEFLARLPGANHFVDEPARGSGVGIGELLLELGDTPTARGILV